MNVAKRRRYAGSKGQILDPICEIRECPSFGKKLQISYGVSDGDTELVGVDEAAEMLPAPLAPGCLGE